MSTDSFRVFGNNGTHTFDGDITTGTGASAAVLAALVAASDHLPIIADFEMLDVTPGVRIVETGGGTKVAEGGFYDTYNVVLNTIPAANVTVTLHAEFTARSRQRCRRGGESALHARQRAHAAGGHRQRDG